jgi:hypothetical protein
MGESLKFTYYYYLSVTTAFSFCADSHQSSRYSGCESSGWRREWPKSIESMLMSSQSSSSSSRIAVIRSRIDSRLSLDLGGGDGELRPFVVSDWI